mgnify:FL=1
MLFRSHSEQGRLGLLNLDRARSERLAGLNLAYRERFGFPCIVALRLHASLESVLDEMARRLAADEPVERAAALEQVAHITRGRLEKILESES